MLCQCRAQKLELAFYCSLAFLFLLSTASSVVAWVSSISSLDVAAQDTAPQNPNSLYFLLLSFRRMAFSLSCGQNLQS